ncbi:SGNH/GDSL hydrolase family protein [Niastella caeni]|nr:SGNH/GDSL hydrolase family protein [Niastella caeni]
MKKLILSITILLSFVTSYGQIPTDTSDLRTKINSWIVTNGTKQITATQVNQLFNGVASLMKAYAIDSAYRIADTLFLVRRGGFTTIKVTLNTGGAPSETDPTVPTVAKALTGSDTSRWNNKQDALAAGSGLSIVANVISAGTTTAQWNADKLQGNNISATSPTTGQILKWNGSAWAPANESGGSGGDSSIFATRYRVDTAIANVRGEMPRVDSAYTIGIMYDSSAWGSASSSFTVTGSPTINANKIRLPAGAKINWLHASMLEQETLQVDFKYKALLSTDSAFTVGWESPHPNLSVSLYGRVRTATGVVRIFAVVNGTPSEAVLSASSNMSGGISVDDSLTYVFYRNKDTTKFTVINHTSGQTGFATTIRNFQASGETGGLHNTAYFSLVNSAGTTNSVELCRIKYSSHALKQPIAALIGNSISSGSFATEINKRFGDLCKFVICAGGGDISASGVLQTYALVRHLKPQYAFIMLGGNDLAYSVPTATWQANLLLLHDSLIAHGSKIIWLLATPRTGLDITPVNDFIKATFPFTYIDTYTPLWSGTGTNLSGTYDSGDGVHPNEAGHAKIAEVIMSHHLYKAIENVYYRKQNLEAIYRSKAFNIAGDGSVLMNSFTSNAAGKLQVYGLQWNEQALNGNHYLLVKNTTAGSNAQTNIRVQNNNNDFAGTGIYSTSTSANGVLAAGGSYTLGSPSAGHSIVATAGPIKFAAGGLTEHMRLASSGNLLIGKTSDDGNLLQVAGLQRNEFTTTGNAYLIVKNSGSGANAQTNIRAQNDNDDFSSNGIYSTGTSANGVLAPGGSYNLGSPSAGHSIVALAGPLKFAAGGTTEGMRLNSSNELQLNSTSDLGASKLQVTGTIQMQDGNQASGKVLTSDANGVGTWQTPTGGITSINSQSGPSITIQGGSGITVNTTTNTVTVSADPTSDIFTRTIDVQYTTQSNSGTSATDLYTKTVAGLTLGADGTSLSFESAGTFNDASTTYDMNVYFAGTSISGTTALSITATGSWSMRGTIIRTGTNTLRSTITWNIDGKVYTNYATLGSLDFTTSNILKITGTAGGGSATTGDINATLWKVIYQP